MTTTDVTPDVDGAAVPSEIAAGLFARLEAAWNEADGDAFASAFVDDAEFVDVRGGYHHGAGEVADGHQELFDSIYTGSEVRYRVSRVRRISPDVIVAVVSGTLTAPIGPLEGTTSCRITAVIVAGGRRWAIAAFHNTIVAAAA